MSQSPHPERPGAYPFASVPGTSVQLSDGFWSTRLETNVSVTLPFGIQKCIEEGRLRNFERAGRVRDDAYEGKMPFDDTDIYKLIEAASYALMARPDPRLQRFLDDAISKIAIAIEPDGYLTTYKTIDPEFSPAPWVKAGPRWERELEGSHELYNSGHLYEAAHAHYLATGSTALLDIARKNAELIDQTFGPGRRLTPPGHQIIETGLYKLAEITGEERYRRLARFFLEQRGNARGHELHGPINQDHLPVVEQREAVGHAVRAVYMYAGMVDVAVFDEDEALRAAVLALWENVVERKLYITGGLGARHDGEAFGDAFELPNRAAYAETCAAIASVLWNQRLFSMSGDSKYVDVLERTLYNGMLAGVSLSGDRFFYPNPLESDGVYAFNQGAATRKPWFDCSCCPTNLARVLPLVPSFIYAVRDDHVFVNLFIASRATFDLDGGALALTQTTGYPWAGQVELAIELPEPRAFSLHVRVPGWAREQPVPGELYRYLGREGAQPALFVNGERTPIVLENGYALLERTWSPGDTVMLELPLRVRRVVSDSRVNEDRHKVALECGPLVFCAEAPDNEGSVLDLVLPDTAELSLSSRPGLLGGVNVIEGVAHSASGSTRQLLAIPYFAWANRGEAEMVVWFPRQAGTG